MKEVTFTLEEWGLFQSLMNSLATRYSQPRLWGQLRESVNNRLEFERALTVEEHQQVQGLRLFLHHWGLPADAIPERILLHRGHHWLSYELGGDYRLDIVGDSYYEGSDRRSCFFRLTYYREVVADAQEREDHCFTVRVFVPHRMPPAWDQNKGSDYAY